MRMITGLATVSPLRGLWNAMLATGEAGAVGSTPSSRSGASTSPGSSAGASGAAELAPA